MDPLVADPRAWPLALACLAAFCAGLVDAMAGGGGLIQLPAVLALMPGAPPAVALGTNKAASIWGTAVALLRYRGALALPWRSIGAAAAVAFVGSALGAALAARLPPGVFRPLAVPVLGLVAAFVFFRPDFGALARGRERPALAAGLGLLIGFYDGLIGPGTGTFLIFALIYALGLDFVGASAGAKAVNVATNLAALLVFGAGGQIRWDWAAPMAVCNALGGGLGAKLALRGGAAVVRRVVQVVVCALLAKLGYDLLAG